MADGRPLLLFQRKLQGTDFLCRKGWMAMAGPYQTLEGAIDCLLHAAIPRKEIDSIPLTDALGRVTARDLTARIDQPPFDRSPLDGYALRHEDSRGACETHPVRLRIAAQTYAGDRPAGGVAQEEAVRLMTGSPIPLGADAVIRQEDTREEAGEVLLFRELKKHENYCFRGEDVPKGAVLLPRGTRLDPAAIGVLAGQGMTEVPVWRSVSVGILSTGSELVPAGQPLQPGQIYDSNAAFLAARVRMAGAIPLVSGSVADDLNRLAETIEYLLSRCPLVVTSGGVSVGERDFMPKVAEVLGAEQLFHGVLLKPGGPAMACRVGRGILLCLAGNPFAAVAGFELMGMPLLRYLMGRRDILSRRTVGTLENGFEKASRGRRFVRATIEGNKVRLPEGHSSGMLASLIGCNCLIDIPAGSPPLEPGMSVQVVLME